MAGGVEGGGVGGAYWSLGFYPCYDGFQPEAEASVYTRIWIADVRCVGSELAYCGGALHRTGLYGHFLKPGLVSIRTMPLPDDTFKRAAETGENEAHFDPSLALYDNRSSQRTWLKLQDGSAVLRQELRAESNLSSHPAQVFRCLTSAPMGQI